jgi:hypothetical protein
MKFFKSILFLLVSSLVFSQTNSNQEIGNFSELKVYDLIEVELFKSNMNKVDVTGENIEDVKIINDNGVLKIRMELDERFDGNQTFVKIYYTSIEIIDANEGAEIISKEALKQNSIELKTQEGGKINVNLDVNFSTIKSVSGGVIDASGKSTNQDITINSGGVFNGKDLITKDTKITVTAGGSADINVIENAKIKVTAGGNVYVYGNPKNIKKSKFAGGNIKLMN